MPCKSQSISHQLETPGQWTVSSYSMLTTGESYMSDVARNCVASQIKDCYQSNSNANGSKNADLVCTAYVRIIIPTKVIIMSGR